MSNLRKATRRKAKIRLGISAVSGGGKTYSALLIASGMTSWDKIALIDTENGSGDLYSQLGAYNVLPISAPFTPEKYIEAIKECESAGMEVIIIDSMTHEWDGKGGILEIHSKMQGNSFTNWGVVGQRHEAFKTAIVESKCHIITTVRRKQEYEISKDSNGKQKVEKLGLKEITRDGWDYEVTVNLEIDINHHASSTKDRTFLFDGKPPFVPTAETGKAILAWCEEGEIPEEPKLPELTEQHPQFKYTCQAIKNGTPMETVRKAFIVSKSVEDRIIEINNIPA